MNVTRFSAKRWIINRNHVSLTEALLNNISTYAVLSGDSPAVIPLV